MPGTRSAASTRYRRHTAQISQVPYLPGVDGLRAIAVIAVMLYHADLYAHRRIPWLQGGFLGVEVFFVISGYLITLLLLAEEERNGRISVIDFWRRRTRRLVPAVLVLLTAVTALYGLVPYLRDEAKTKMGWSALFGFFYSSNWYQISIGQSYTANQGRAPLLRHLWSLAVEEQFYVVWPIVMVVALRRFRGRHARLGQWFFGISLALTVLTSQMYLVMRVSDATSSWFNWNLLYLGTQSRASGLLLGAGMAMVWRPYAIARSPLRTKGRLVSILGLVGIVGLGASFWYFRTDTNVEGESIGFAPLFCGGFLFVGICTLFLIAAATHLSAGLGSGLLASKPLHWVGQRSYGLYLWHWPVFQLMRPGAADQGGDIDLPFWVVMAFRLIVTGAVTELSYRFVETPIRRGELRSMLRAAVRRGPGAQRRRAIFASGVLATIGMPTVAIAMIVPSHALTDYDIAIQDGQSAYCSITDPACLTSLPQPAIATPDSGTAPPTSTATGTAPATVATTVPEPGATLPETTVAPPTTAAPTTVPPTTKPPQPIKLFAVGDSVMLGASRTMTEQGIWTDAQVSRQMKDGVAIAQYLFDRKLLGKVVIVHLGTNGRVSQERVDQIMALTAKVPRVIFLTVKVSSKPWEGANNDIIRAIPKRFPKRDVVVVDWNALSATRGNVFCSDGIHLCKNGPAFYTSLIVAAIKAK
jgi:peptidoglycan/LPS O-acetylase OafA/YrhL